MLYHKRFSVYNEDDKPSSPLGLHQLQRINRDSGAGWLPLTKDRCRDVITSSAWRMPPIKYKFCLPPSQSSEVFKRCSGAIRGHKRGYRLHSPPCIGGLRIWVSGNDGVRYRDPEGSYLSGILEMTIRPSAGDLLEQPEGRRKGLIQRNNSGVGVQQTESVILLLKIVTLLLVYFVLSIYFFYHLRFSYKKEKDNKRYLAVIIAICNFTKQLRVF